MQHFNDLTQIKIQKIFKKEIEISLLREVILDYKHSKLDEERYFEILRCLSLLKEYF